MKWGLRSLHSQLLSVEDVAHMLVQPLHVILSRELKLFHLLSHVAGCLPAFVENPLDGTDRQLRAWADGCHDDLVRDVAN